MKQLSGLKPLLRSALLGGVLSLCNANAQAVERMLSGQWEFTLTTAGESRTASYCATPEEVNGANGDALVGRQYAEKKSKGRCTVKSYEAVGDKVSYALICGNREIDSVTIFHGDTYEGQKTTIGDGQSVVTQVKARHLGPCR